MNELGLVVRSRIRCGDWVLPSSIALPGRREGASISYYKASSHGDDRKLIDIPRESIGLGEEGVVVEVGGGVDGGRGELFSRAGERGVESRAAALEKPFFVGTSPRRVHCSCGDPCAAGCRSNLLSTHAFPAPSFNLPPTPKTPTAVNFFPRFQLSTKHTLFEDRFDSNLT